MDACKLSLFVLLLGASCAGAQAHPEKNTTASYAEVYGGPAFTGSNPGNGTFGAGGGLDLQFSHGLGLVGDFTLCRGSGGSANNTTVTDYLFGPRYSMPILKSIRCPGLRTIPGRRPVHEQ